MVWITDRPDMTSAVYSGSKATNQTNELDIEKKYHIIYEFESPPIKNQMVESLRIRQACSFAETILGLEVRNMK